MNQFNEGDKVKMVSGELKGKFGTVGQRGEWGGYDAYGVNGDNGKWAAVAMPWQIEKINPAKPLLLRLFNWWRGEEILP